MSNINPAVIDQGPRPRPGLQLSSLFTDNAVFQSGMTVPVWGWTGPCHLVKAEIAGKIAFCRANARGRFQLRLPALKAGGPHKLKVTDIDTGESQIVKNVLVGEVWLASGQSNMEYRFGALDPVTTRMKESELLTHDLQRREFFATTLKAKGKLRFFHVDSNCSGAAAEEPGGRWLEMSDENGVILTAVGGWFAKRLQESLDVPVGIIASSVGGTRVQAWTSRAGLAVAGKFSDAEITQYDSMFTNEAIWTKGNAGIIAKGMKPAPSPAKLLKQGWAEIDFDDGDWKNLDVPGSWIAQAISGNGVVWCRQEIDLPKKWAGKKLTLRLGGIDKQDITYFNGREVGRMGKGIETDFWNVKRHYAVPAGLAKAGKNVITVRAFSFMMDGALGGRPNDYSLTLDETGETILLGSVWKIKTECDWGHISYAALLEPGPSNSNTAGILFDNMIAPLIPYAIKGVIWYQGENNATSIEDAQKYSQHLCLMIEDWRRQWGEGDFPFLQVQLAGYGACDGFNDNAVWPYLREAQEISCRILPNVDMVTAIDVGNAVDIHPQDKKSVGQRLANLALARVYGLLKPERASSPTVAGLSRVGRNVIIEFEDCLGIRVRHEEGSSIFLAGKDGKFFPADMVTVSGRQLAVSSSKVRCPKFIRYAWTGCPTCTIYSSSGLPALPFRADLC